MTHLIDVDLGKTGDAWMTGACAEILGALAERLKVEARMDEIDAETAA